MENQKMLVNGGMGFFGTNIVNELHELNLISLHGNP
jgi:hypothetical protein